MMTHDGNGSPVLIPIGHMGEESDDPSLHKIFISCVHFRGKDNGAIQSYIQDNLAEMYVELLLNPDDNFTIPEAFVDIIATAMAQHTSADNNTITLKNTDLLYLIEYIRIYKVRAVSSPYASMGWPGIQIP